MASQALTKGALWMQNVDYPASWDRALIDALYPSEGVIDGFVVAPNTGLDITVSGGRAVVQGDEVANQGKYLIDQDGVVTLTLASVGVTRTEYVYIAINDTAVAGGRAGNNVSIDTSTTAPPDSALLLATLTLPGGTTTITAGMIAGSGLVADVVAPSSVVTAKIGDLAVTTAKITDLNVTTGKIAAAAVTTAKIAALNVTTSTIADLNVTTGKIADAAVTTAKLSSALQTLLDVIDPADAITAIGGATAPTGWALCDGAAYSRTLYPATFARLNAAGLPYGSGDGSLTFNVPDLRNRFVVGKGTATWSDALNESGGSKDAIVPIHGHTATSGNDSPNHIHDTWNSGNEMLYRAGSGTRAIVTTIDPPDANFVLTWAAGTALDTGQNTTNHTHVITVNTATGGVAVTDANLPPYRTLNYVIRLR